MPTFLAQFTDAEIKVRFKEPFLTAGIDQAFTGIIPQGIHRGFRLAPSIANLTVTVEADAVDNDHVAAYATADGYTLRLRRTGGDFTIDLAPFVSKTVVIAIFAEYTLATTTTAVIRAYELSPADEFTVAPELSELVVLGTVVVPAAGVIPTNDIKPLYRTLAWDHVGSDATGWEQVIENGNFELAAVAGTFVAADRGYLPHWDTQYILPAHTWAISTTSPHTGRYELQVTGTGVTSLSIIPTDRIVAVQPGQLIRVSFWLRGNLWSGVGGGGSQGFQLSFYGPNLSLIAFRLVQDLTLTGTFGWTHFDQYIEVPANVAWLVPMIVVYDPTPATGSLFFDDIRIWMEKGPGTIPFSSVQDGLTNGGHLVGQIGIAETNVAAFGITQNLETFVKGVLQLHRSDNEAPSVRRYRWRRLDSNPWAFRMSEGALLLEGLTDTDDKAEFPRIRAEIADPVTNPYTNVLEVHSPAGYPAHHRRYHKIGFNQSDIWEVLNARWDDLAGDYTLDDPTNTDATGLLLTTVGGGALLLVGHDKADGSPFATWDTLFQVLGTPADPSAEVRVTDGKLAFDGTTVISNPAKTTNPIANTLYAKNIVKAWGHFSTDGAGGITLEEGFGINGAGCSVSGSTATIDLYDDMDSTKYAVIPAARAITSANPNLSFRAIDVGPTQSVGSFQLRMFEFVFDGPSDHVDFWDFTAGAKAADFYVVVLGQQTT